MIRSSSFKKKKKRKETNSSACVRVWPVLASWDSAVDDHWGSRRLWDHAGLWAGGASVRCGRAAAAADVGGGCGADFVVDLLWPSASGTRPRLSRKRKKSRKVVNAIWLMIELPYFTDYKSHFFFHSLAGQMTYMCNKVHHFTCS